jgi:hypothetical protein
MSKRRNKSRVGATQAECAEDLDKAHEIIQENFDWLEAHGFIARTGEVRNGQPVYVITPLGRQQTGGHDDGASNLVQ